MCLDQSNFSSLKHVQIISNQAAQWQGEAQIETV